MRPYSILFLPLGIILLFSCVLNTYAEDNIIPPNPGSLKDVDYCQSILKDNTTTTLTIEHFGLSDKLIFPITFDTFEGENNVVPSDSIWMIHTAFISKNEMHCLCKQFQDGGFFSKTSDTCYEFGKFLFEIKQKRRKIKTFSTNRKNSIQLFQEMLLCLPKDSKAKALLEDNIKRIQY